LLILTKNVNGETMADEDLGNVLDDNFEAHKRTVAIEVLGERTHLTMALIAKLLDHPKHGAVIQQITLQELLDVKMAEAGGSEEAEEAEEEAPAIAAKPAAKKKAKPAAKKKAAKAKAKPAAKKKTTKKKAKKAAKGKGGKKQKADAGKKKPRLNRDLGYAEIKKALKAAKEPVGNGHLCNVTGFEPVQVRTFLKELAKKGVVKVQGKGKATKYSLK
jgi:hypothetical protein